MHMQADVYHEAADRVSVMFRAVDEAGREIFNVPSIRVPCASYENARMVADAYNAPLDKPKPLGELIGKF